MNLVMVELMSFSGYLSFKKIILPFKDQRSADIVRRQLSDLGKKINSDKRPVFTRKKIADDIRVAEAKPPLINQQCVVYGIQM